MYLMTDPEPWPFIFCHIFIKKNTKEARNNSLFSLKWWAYRYMDIIKIVFCVIRALWHMGDWKSISQTLLELPGCTVYVQSDHLLSCTRINSCCRRTFRIVLKQELKTMCELWLISLLPSGAAVSFLLPTPEEPQLLLWINYFFFSLEFPFNCLYFIFLAEWSSVWQHIF